MTMRLESINIQNFLGLHDLRRAVSAPTLLVCGPNGAGKSSLLDAIRFAITGDMPRGIAARGTERNSIVTEGAAKGYAEVTIDGYTARRAIGSGTLTGDAAPAYIGLQYALDPASFAAAPEDARRRLLFELMDVKADRETVVKIMQDHEVPESIIEKVLPMLRGGFDSAVGEARNKASESRGAWKAITGETYGTQKAATWAPETPGEAPTDGEITAAEAAIETARARVDHLVEVAGKVRAALPEDHRAALEAEAAKAEQAEADIARAELALERASDHLAELQKRAYAPATLTCPCCEAELVLKDAQLVAAEDGTAESRPSQDEIQQAKTAEQVARTSLAEARGAYTAAVGARRSLQTATTVTDAERAEAEKLEEARRGLALHQGAHATLLQARHHAEQARSLEVRAKAEHLLVKGWMQVQELCSPGGIPAVLVARALDPFNAMLRGQAALAGFQPAQVERDLSLTYAGRAYALCSESEQWRADALFAAAIAKLSGAKILLLDRFDVLHPKDRGQVLDWAIDELSQMGTVVLAGTLSKAPDAEECLDVLWLEGSASLEKAAA